MLYHPYKTTAIENLANNPNQSLYIFWFIFQFLFRERLGICKNFEVILRNRWARKITEYLKEMWISQNIKSGTFNLG